MFLSPSLSAARMGSFGQSSIDHLPGVYCSMEIRSIECRIVDYSDGPIRLKENPPDVKAFFFCQSL